MQIDRSTRVVNDLSNKEFAIIETVESLGESDVEVEFRGKRLAADPPFPSLVPGR